MLSNLKKWWNRPVWVSPTIKSLDNLLNKGYVKDTSAGLCINCILQVPDETRANIFGTWPKYTGRFRFPVPHPHMKPNEAYGMRGMYDKTTEYGRNRLELAEFIRQALLKEYY